MNEEMVERNSAECKKTMKDIATEADISECYYSQIESGARDASVTVAKKIANVLGFPWEKFFEDGEVG